uniref:Uncharacterized protein n=1 Tax=Strongyloides papillosus TaxID=174720 RepID=A0A0N5B253_STREA
MVYIPQQPQNDSHLTQYQENPVIILPKMSNTVAGSCINSIMKVINTDNTPTDSYILMPISVIASNDPSSSFHIPRPVAKIHKSSSLSLSTLNLNPHSNSISVSPFLNDNNIKKSSSRYQLQSKRNFDKGRPFRSTIGPSKGVNIPYNHNLPPLLNSSSLSTANIRSIESNKIISIYPNTKQQNKLKFDFDNNNILQLDNNQNKRISSEDNSVIYDVPNYNVPPSLPPHSSTKISQNSTFTNIPKLKPLQTPYTTPNNINRYCSVITPIITTKYFIPPPPPPPINHSIAVKESRRQFKEILKNDRKLKRYQKKLQRGLLKRICCSSVSQLLWAILTIIGLGFIAYFILIYYLI